MSTLTLEVFRDGHKSRQFLSRPIDDGFHGNEETLGICARMVREDAAQPDIRAFVLREIVGKVRGHDRDGEIEACYRFARDGIVYRQDPVGVERASDLWSTMYALNPEQPEGDCLIKCEALCTSLASIGHTPFFIAVQQLHRAWSFNHVEAGVYYDGTHYKGKLLPVDAQSNPYLPLDPTPEDFVEGQQAHAVRRMMYRIFE